MSKGKSSFEDHLDIASSGREKTASAKPSNVEGSDLLSKLAAELNLAPTAEGQRFPAGSPEAQAALDGVVNPQVEVAGADVARTAVGSVAHVVADANVAIPIATGEGTSKTVDGLNRTEAAVAAAARDTNAEGDDAVSEKECEKIGQLIAKSFQETLEKNAADAEYAQSLGILKQAGLLDNYNLTDDSITKVASEEVVVDALEKIANAQPLTREDIVLAARQFIEVEKLAAAADAEGRAAAHQAVADAASANAEQEKIASLMEDEKVVAAVKVLKEAGVL